MQVLRSPSAIQGYHFEQPLEGLALLSHCGEQLCSGRHRVPLHRHDRFEFCYVLRSEAFWQVGRQTVRHPPGDLFVAHPQEWHRSADQAHATYQLLYAGVDLQRLGPAGRALAQRLRRERVHQIRRAHDVESVLRGLVRQVASQEPDCAGVARAHLMTLVALLTQRLKCQTEGGDGRHRGPYPLPVETAIRFMREHLDQPLYLADLAAVASYSPAHFCRYFKAHVGLTPAVYHRQLRLEAARLALQRSDFSITSVALAYGFCSSQHFARAFGAAFGITPRQWQRRSS